MVIYTYVGDCGVAGDPDLGYSISSASSLKSPY
jgi:hypothetical protein